MIMDIIKDFISENMYNKKCPYAMNPTRIVMHNTANDASAAKEIAFMKRSTSCTSYHFAVDDKEIIQAIPLNRNAWHAGDGENGIGNRQGISIEICYSLSGGAKFDKAEENAAMLCANLLMRYGWSVDRITKHQDYSGKYCPHRTLDKGWNRFIDMVKKYLFIEEMNTQMARFNDTNGHWAEKHIDKLADYGIVNGDGNGNFMPDKPVTRAEVAVMVANALTYIGK